MTETRGSRTITRRWPDNDASRAVILCARDDLVQEQCVNADGGTHEFAAVEGPFEVWTRQVTSREGTLVETTTFRVRIPWFSWLFLPLIIRTVRRSRRATLRGEKVTLRQLWWAPPDVMTPRQVHVLGLLAAAAMSSAFTNTAFTQTVTFAADDFGVGNTAVGIAGALVRAGILVTIPLAIAADRIGRRTVIIAAAWAAPILTASGAIAPNFEFLVATQALGRPVGLALDFLIAVVAAEEMPKNSRAYAVGIMAMASGLGAGVAVISLPLTDTGPAGWRWVFLITLIWITVARDIGRRLPESVRYLAPHVERVPINRGRFVTLAAILVGVNLLVAPASFFQNRYLSDVRGMSGSSIALFSLSTATPAAVGLIIGGRLADRRGRRVLISVALPFAALLVIASFHAAGTVMWMCAFGGGLLGGVAYPALAVYRAELFPTGNRGRAAGLLTVAALLGGVAGLLGAGSLLDTGRSYGTVMATLGIGQAVALVLVLTRLPETAHRDLDEISDVTGAASRTAN